MDGMRQAETRWGEIRDTEQKESRETFLNRGCSSLFGGSGGGFLNLLLSCLLVGDVCIQSTSQRGRSDCFDS